MQLFYGRITELMSFYLGNKFKILTFLFTNKKY